MKQLRIVTVCSVLCLSSMITGCKEFYKHAGAHVRTGSVFSPIEISDPTSSINIRALYSMDGIDFYAAKNCYVKMWYTNYYTNTYLGIIETIGRQSSEVEIDPTEYLAE